MMKYLTEATYENKVSSAQAVGGSKWDQAAPPGRALSRTAHPRVACVVHSIRTPGQEVERAQDEEIRSQTLWKAHQVPFIRSCLPNDLHLPRVPPGDPAFMGTGGYRVLVMTLYHLLQLEKEKDNHTHL